MKLEKSNLGISKAALEVTEVLETLDLGETSNKWLFTSAWYNGREKGICVRLEEIGTSNNVIITFGECRSSDNIFVDTWITSDVIYINPPTVENYPDYAYKSRKYFSYDQTAQAALYVASLINKNL